MGQLLFCLVFSIKLAPLEAWTNFFLFLFYSIKLVPSQSVGVRENPNGLENCLFPSLHPSFFAISFSSFQMKLSMTVNNRTLNNMFGMQMTENSLAGFLRSDRKFLFGTLKFLKILVAKILYSEDFWIRPSL